MISPVNIVKAVLFFVFFTTTVNAYAQDEKVGTWELVNVEYYIKSKGFVWAEIQTRSQKMYQDFFYHELKGGTGYKPNRNVTVLLGAGQYATYSNGGNFKSPVVSHEFRIWEQLVLNNFLGRAKIEHRYRIEQRWRNAEYRNRFRYRLNPVIPVNKNSLEKGALFVSLYDEVFLTDVGPHFERNRVYAGLGYEFSQPVTLQAGWLNQYDFSSANIATNKNFLQVTLYLQLHKK
jgi:hypothetical protein